MRTALIEKAASFAAIAHLGQVDLIGVPYIAHPACVALFTEQAGGDEFDIAAAWLHDVIEDTGVTVGTLVDAGFPTSVIDLVVAVSQRPGQTRDDYRAQIKQFGQRAVRLKLSDIEHNTLPDRVARALALEGQETTARRLKKYADDLAYFEQAA